MIEDNNTQKKRLAKNTLILYLRTIVTLAISLYTSRVVLQVLGINDYGIYNIVGGFVSLFAVVSQTMVASTQRFLTYELGKSANNHSREVFSAAMTIHIVLGLILILLFETLGLWFLNNKLNIETNRMVATNFIYQFSVITFVVQLIRSPFEASVIAHERMSTFAYVNIAEAVFKLLVLFLIPLITIDRLVQYGMYLLFLSLFVFVFYTTYCKIKFEEIVFVQVKDKNYYRQMVSFAGYNFFGSCSAIMANQGVNVILNMFFGVTVNAARGIALQVGNAISKFVGDFTTAIKPQITKSYAKGDLSYTISLVNRGSKFSFFLYLLFSLPIAIDTPLILKMWLENVPDYAILFVRWTLLISLLNTFANPLTTFAFATGDIKRLSIWIGCIRLTVLPVAYMLFSLGYPPAYAYIVCFLSDFVLLFVRLFIVCSVTKISALSYVKEVLSRAFLVLLLSVFSSMFLHGLYNVAGVNSLFVFVVVSSIITTFIIAVVGLDTRERLFVINIVKNKFSK